MEINEKNEFINREMTIENNILIENLQKKVVENFNLKNQNEKFKLENEKLKNEVESLKNTNENIINKYENVRTEIERIKYSRSYKLMQRVRKILKRG